MCGDERVDKTTNINPQDFIEAINRAEKLGAFKALNWLHFQIGDNATVEDIVSLLDESLAVFNEQLFNDFKKQNFLLTDLDTIIERRKKQETGEA
jgi:hypothetical protein